MAPLSLAARLRPLALLVLATPALALSDDPQPGWQSSSQPSPAAFAATCTLPGGDIVTFDGLSVDRWSAGGAFVSNLVTLPGFTFASFVETAPSGTAVVFGESSNGDVFQVDVDGSGLVTLATLPFNYDAAFLPNGDVVVSAATGGFGADNEVFLISGAPPAAAPLGVVSGPSGPVAVAPDGTLYYATQDPNFPAAPGSTDVLAWSAAQVAAGGLSNANATVFGAGFDGGGSLAVDPVSGEVYLAETNFGLTLYQIRRVGADPASSPLVVDDGADFISNLEVVDAGGPGSLEAWQPEVGRNLKYNSGADLFTVRPKRPVLTATGPGTSGPGAVTFSVTGGVPGGTMYAAACPQGAVGPKEVAIPFPTFLWVTAFDVPSTRRGSSFLQLDAQGDGSFVLNNPGNLQGVYAWQFLVGDGAGVFLGSTTTVSF